MPQCKAKFCNVKGGGGGSGNKCLCHTRSKEEQTTLSTVDPQSREKNLDIKTYKYSKQNIAYIPVRNMSAYSTSKKVVSKRINR